MEIIRLTQLELLKLEYIDLLLKYSDFMAIFFILISAIVIAISYEKKKIKVLLIYSPFFAIMLAGLILGGKILFADIYYPQALRKDMAFTEIKRGTNGVNSFIIAKVFGGSTGQTKIINGTLTNPIFPEKLGTFNIYLDDYQIYINYLGRNWTLSKQSKLHHGRTEVSDEINLPINKVIKIVQHIHDEKKNEDYILWKLAYGNNQELKLQKNYTTDTEMLIPPDINEIIILILDDGKKDDLYQAFEILKTEKI